MRTIWQGSRMNAFTNVLNSMRSTRLFFLHDDVPASVPAFPSGHRAHQAFKFQAKAVITM